MVPAGRRATFERLAIPLRCLHHRLLGQLHKRHEVALGPYGGPQDLVWEQKLAQGSLEADRARRDGPVGESVRYRIGVGIEHRLAALAPRART